MAISINQDIVGKLTSISIDRSSNFVDNKPVRWLLTLEVQKSAPRVGTETYYISCDARVLDSSYFKLGLDSSNYQKLKKGDELDVAVNKNIELSSIVIRATLDSLSSKKLQIGSRVLLNATKVEVETSLDAVREPDEIYQNTNNGKPAPWPGRDLVPPFVPVPVPNDGLSLGSSKIRIGYAVFDNPIHFVEQTRTTNLSQLPSLRQSGTMKKGTGHAYESFNISWIANGPEEITQSVQEVFEQIALTPFTTAEGGPFGSLDEVGDIPYHSLAVRNFSISTIDGLPGAVQVDVAFDPFNWEFYTPICDGIYPRYTMDDMICWPLVKIWAKTSERSRYSGQRFTGKLSFSFPNLEASQALDELFDTDNSVSDATDIEALHTLQNQLKKTGDISSRNAKEVLHPTGSQTGVRYFVIKVNDPKIYQQFVPQAADRDDSDVQNGGEGIWFVGLSDWARLNAANLIDDQGNFLPTSATVNADYITKAFSTGKPLEPDTRTSPINDSIGIADIKRPGFGNQPLDIQIRDWMLSKYGLSSVPGSGDAAYSQYQTIILPEIQKRIKEPWVYFGIVLRTDRTNAPRLKKHLAKVIDQNQREVQFKYDSIGNKLDKIFSNTDITSVVLDVSPESNQDIIVERISGARGHNLAITSMRGDPLPVHQYMGGLDATMIVEGKCFGTEAKQTLEDLKREFDQRAIFVKSRKLAIELNDVKKSEAAGSAFLRVENEIFQLLGVDFVMPVTLTFQSIDGQPGVWAFTLTLIEFDPKQKKAEEIQFLPTTWDSIGRVYEYGGNSSNNNPILDKGLEYFSLQASLAQQETYPDMSLPTQGEFEFWVTALRKGAELWNPKKQTDIFRDAKDKKNLSPEEKAICRLVADQFFPQYASRIKKFLTVDDKTSKRESTAYVEPDFYCWYDPDHSFGSIFDTLSEHLMGPGPQQDAEGRPKNKEGYTLEAPGREDSVKDPTKEPIAPYTEHDPNYGITSVYSHKFWAGNPERVSVERELVEAREQYSYPEKRASEARKVMTEYETKLDQTDGAWWPELAGKNISFVDRKTETVRITPEQERDFMGGFLNGTTLNPQYTPDPGEKPYAADAIFGDTTKYFYLDWRQSMIMRVASRLSARPKAGNWNDTSNSHFWASNESALRNDGKSEFKFINTDAIEEQGMAVIEKAILESVDYFGLSPSDLLKQYGGPIDTPQDPSGFTPSATFMPYVPPPLVVNFAAMPFICRTAVINANFRYVRSNGIPAGFVFSTAENAIKENWNFVDAIAAKYKVDPNVIRAVFMKRDGFGQYDPIASPDGGFGDLDIETTQSARSHDTNTARNNIDIFARVYRRYLDKLSNVPSLALIATNMALTTVAKRQYWDSDTNEIRSEVLSDLQAMASSINISRYSPGSARLISTAIRKYWAAASVVDEYYTGYISLCRVFGTYWDPSFFGTSFDAFFFPLNALIVLDAEDNKGNMLTNFSPSGDEVNISTSRSTVDYLPRELLNTEFDLNNASLELAAEQAKKHRAALEPASEGAIYGSLVDMREHSPFGRLSGAFPTFQIILINEGFYWASGNKKLWDQFYTRTGVASIEVHRTRHMPGGSATVTFSNMFHNITAYAQMEAMAHELALKENERIKDFVLKPWVAISDIWNDLIVKNVKPDVIDAWKRCHLKRVALGAGTRLQIRLGYGSNPAKLPIIFNGTVIDAPVSDGYVILTAVSDGHELEKPSTTKLVKSGNAFAFQDGGIAGSGKDPSSIISETLVGATLWDDIFQGNFRDFSHGIAHFGETYFEGTRHYPAEVQINIYAAKRTRLEQGLSTLDQYNLINAITNWGNENNKFSVEVQEPTPWKVIEVCRRACQDFVASAETFAMRSTVFFGKWWWPYHYTYSSAITNLGNLSNAFVGAGFLGSGLEDEAKRQEQLSRILNKNPDGSGSTQSQTPSGGISDASFDKAYTGQYADLAKIVFRRAKADRPHSVIVSVQHTKTTTRAQIIKEVREISNQYDNTDIIDTPQQQRQRDRIRNNPAEVPNETIYSFKVIWTDGTFTEYTISQNKELQFVNAGSDTIRVDPYQTIANTAPVSLGQDGKIPADFLKDVENLVTYLKWKPYMQAYIAHSGINLLDNNIRADNSKVYTDATGLHLYNGWLSGDSVSKTITYSVDTDIHPGDRKTMMVDTGIMLTGLQSGGEAIAGGLLTGLSYIPLVGGLFEGGRKYIEESPTTPAIENAVVSALIDSVKEMYQGWFTIMGQATVKPRDLFLLTDHITDLKGPVFVKEVIHRMDAQVGFITMVSPDAVVLPHSSIFGHHLVVSLSCGFLQRLGGFWIMKSGAAGMWAAFNGKINRKINAASSTDYAKYKKLQRMFENSKTQTNIKLFNQLDAEMSKKVKALTDAGKTDSAEFKKLTQAWTNLHKRYDQNSSLSNLLEFAKQQGIAVDITKFDIDGGQLVAKQIAFETELLKEEAQMLKDVKTNKILADLDTDEAIEAVHKYINNKRAGWVASNSGEVNTILKNSIGSIDVKELQSRAEELLSSKNRKLIENSVGRKVSNDEILKIDKELSDIVDKLQIAVDEGEISHLELDRALRQLINSPVARWTDNAALDFFRGAFRSAVDTPQTLVKGVLGIITESKASAATFASRKSVSLHPTSKIGNIIRLYKASKTIGTDIKEGAEVVKAATRAKRLAKLKVLRLLKLATGAGTGVRILKYMGPQAVVSLAMDAAIYIIGGSLIEGYNARLRARQCVKIIPLMSGSIPYTAGIRGHQGAVIGDSPSWADELISGLHGGGNIFPGWLSTTFGISSALLGIELPDYGITETDQKWLNKVREEENARGEYGK